MEKVVEFEHFKFVSAKTYGVDSVSVTFKGSRKEFVIASFVGAEFRSITVGDLIYGDYYFPRAKGDPWMIDTPYDNMKKYKIQASVVEMLYHLSVPYLVILTPLTPEQK